MKNIILFIALIFSLTGQSWAFGGRSSFGVYVGPGYYYPHYYGYPYPYYYPPAPVVVQQPQVYIEQTPVNQPVPVAIPTQQAPAVQAATADWYYCAPTKTYFPYVKECAEAWIRVTPTPPAPVKAP